MQHKSLILGFCGLLLMGCATASNDPNYVKVTPAQRLYVGRVSVVLNGQPGEKCEVYMTDDLIANMKVSEDGYMIYRTERKDPGIAKISCMHKLSTFKGAWHIQDLPLKTFVRPAAADKVTYFGDLTIIWKIDPSATAAAPIVDDIHGPMKIGVVKNSGELTVKIEDHKAEAETYAKANWKILEGRTIESNVVKPVDIN